jgi:2-oxo-3-hexenedioate decarboxylase
VLADELIEAGYATARALHQERLARGWKRVGRKIGFTNRNLWARYGVDQPMWGTVYDRTLIRAETNRASVGLAGLAQPRIEPEICFGLKAAPRSADPGALLASIEWVAHSIEIVQCRQPGWKVSIADCAADNGLHGRLVVGTPVPLGELEGVVEKLPVVRVDLFKGKTRIDSGIGANVLGSPLLAFGHLVELLDKQTSLVAGEIVTTGVLTDAHAVAPGEVWSTAIFGLPLAGLTITFA